MKWIIRAVCIACVSMCTITFSGFKGEWVASRMQEIEQKLNTIDADNACNKNASTQLKDIQATVQDVRDSAEKYHKEHSNEWSWWPF